MEIKEIISKVEKKEVNYVYVKYRDEEELYGARVEDFRDDSLILVVHLSQKHRTPNNDGVVDTKFNNDWTVVSPLIVEIEK